MEKEVQERFERIESVLDTVGVRLDKVSGRLDQMAGQMDHIRQAHMDLEAAQKNTTVLLNRFVEESNARGAKIDQRITNLTILVDQLIKRDLNGH